jgi:ribose transport system permease protein
MTTDTASVPAKRPIRPRDGLRQTWDATRRFRPVLVVLVLLFVGFSATLDGFLTKTNLENILTSYSIVWIVAMGMTFVLVSGGLDLSVGAVAALAGILLARLLSLGFPGGIAMLMTIVAGGLVGALLNGALVGFLRLNVFVVTLASMTFLTGAVQLWTEGQAKYVTAPIADQVALNEIAGLRTPIWIMLGTFVVCLYIQGRTYLGRDIFAVGGNPLAARLSGIRTNATLTYVYGIVGACAALAGVIAVGRTGAATPDVNQTLPLLAIAAVLLGGTSLSGGWGGVGGTIVGVLFLGVLENGLALAGVPSSWQQVITGVILVVAVLFDRVKLRRTSTEEGLAPAAP